MSTIHPTISLRRLTKVMTLAEIATLNWALEGERASDFPVEIAERLQPARDGYAKRRSISENRRRP